MTLQEEIEALSLELFPEVVKWRRTIHQNPELAFEEHETSKFVSTILSKFNIEHKTGIAKTGIVALINVELTKIHKNPTSPIQQKIYNTHYLLSTK